MDTRMEPLDSYKDIFTLDSGILFLRDYVCFIAFMKDLLFIKFSMSTLIYSGLKELLNISVLSKHRLIEICYNLLKNLF